MTPVYSGVPAIDAECEHTARYSKRIYETVPQLWHLVAGFEPGKCGICGVQICTGAMFSEYLDLPCKFSFRRLRHTQNKLQSGAAAIGKIVAVILEALSHPTSRN
jgi:hypothetical protein